MPTYAYRCEDCSSAYEERRSFAQAGEPSSCPRCEGSRVQRLISVPVLIRSNGGLSYGGGCACSSGGSCACRAASTN